MPTRSRTTARPDARARRPLRAGDARLRDGDRRLRGARSRHGRAALASAGHLPPLVVGGDGAPHASTSTPAAPLGAFPYGRAGQELSLAAGRDARVLHRRPGGAPRHPADRAIDELLDVFADAVSAEEACRRAVTSMVPAGRLRDDVAIVAIQNGAVPMTSWSCTCPPSPGPGRDQARAATLAPPPGGQRLDRRGDHPRRQRGLHQRDRARLLPRPGRLQAPRDADDGQ